MPKSSTVEVTTPVVESTTPAVVKKVVKRRVSKKKKTEEKPVEELNTTQENTILPAEELNNTQENTILPEETTTVLEEKPVVLEQAINDVEEKPLEQEEEHIEDDEPVANNEKKKKKTLKKEDLCPKWDYLFEAYSAELKAARKQPNQNLSLLKYLTQLKNDTYKLLKLRRRKQESEKNSGFMKPVAISDELQQFFGEKSMTEPITRVYITQKLCNYIKQMDLQNPEDKRTIIPDEKLKRLFQIGDDEKEKLTYYSIQQRIQRHIYKL